jgi:hypothetical protein
MILIFCVVGSYAMTNSIYGIIIMLVLGVFAFMLEENGFPVAPIILGLVLGETVRAELHHLHDQVRRLLPRLLRPAHRRRARPAAGLRRFVVLPSNPTGDIHEDLFGQARRDREEVGR